MDCGSVTAPGQGMPWTTAISPARRLRRPPPAPMSRCRSPGYLRHPSTRVQYAARVTNDSDVGGMRQALLGFLELDAYLDDQAIPATVLSGTEELWAPTPSPGTCSSRSSARAKITLDSRSWSR